MAMKITPLEIRQKSFEKHFRGYDKDEVNGFLLTLSQEWERIQDENKELRIKLDSTEREIMKLREVESSLYKTLKTAEDTGANVIEQARQTADLHLKESQMNAEGLMNEAKRKAKDAVDEAELRVKEVLAEMEDRLKDLVENYKKLESTRDDLLLELKRISEDSLDRVDRLKKVQRQFDAVAYLSQARSEVKKLIYPNDVPKRQVKEEKAPVAEAKIVAEKPEEKGNNVDSVEVEKVEMKKETIVEKSTEETKPKTGIKSFFDEIG
jgi:cell division initiation protein